MCCTILKIIQAGSTLIFHWPYGPCVTLYSYLIFIGRLVHVLHYTPIWIMQSLYLYFSTFIWLILAFLFTFTAIYLLIHRIKDIDFAATIDYFRIFIDDKKIHIKRNRKCCPGCLSWCNPWKRRAWLICFFMLTFFLHAHGIRESGRHSRGHIDLSE